MNRYATNTTVPADRSRAEVERTLHRYGATHFAYGSGPTHAMIGFELANRRVRFRLPLPQATDLDIGRTTSGKTRTGAALRNAIDTEARRRWRALALCIKAKLEAVESGITTVEEEFYAHLVLPNGRTVHEHTSEQVVGAIAAGRVPPLLEKL